MIGTNEWLLTYNDAKHSLERSFEVVDRDFYWFMKTGDIPVSYLNNEGDIIPNWKLDEKFCDWYEEVFELFIILEKLQLEEMANEL